MTFFFAVSAIGGRYVRPLEAFVLPKVGDSPVKWVFFAALQRSPGAIHMRATATAFHKPIIPKESVYD